MEEPGTSAATNGGATANDGAGANSSQYNFLPIRDRFRFKRNILAPTTIDARSPFERPGVRPRLHQNPNASYRRGPPSWFLVCGSYVFYAVICFVIFVFTLASIVLEKTAPGMVISHGQSEERRFVEEGFRSQSVRFVPMWRSREAVEGRAREQMRSQGNRVGVRPPKLAVILGNMKADPHTLLLITVIKNLQKLGYVLQVYATGSGKAVSVWERMGCKISIIGSKNYELLDWLSFDGVIVDSIEAKDAISSLMQDPFLSVPVIWVIQEDTLSSRLPAYEEMGWKYLISYWKSIFSRPSVVVFPDFSLPMLYNLLDAGNFFVIPGSPVDVWAAESYRKTDAKKQLKTESGFDVDDTVLLIVGSSLSYDKTCDYPLSSPSLRSLLMKYAKPRETVGSFKFAFVCGNSSLNHDHVLQDAAAELGLFPGSLLIYTFEDVNRLLLAADIVLHMSFQEEQGFPPVVVRAMALGIPVLLPDVPLMKKYVANGSQGILFSSDEPGDLLLAFSPLLSSDGGLSELARRIASSARAHAKNMLASDCINSYAVLLENVVARPPEAFLLRPVSHLQQRGWEWDLVGDESGLEANGMLDLHGGRVESKSSVIFPLEEELGHVNFTDVSVSMNEIMALDIPTDFDWDAIGQIEAFDEHEKLETEEVEERMDRDIGVWDEIYHNARKSEKLNFEANERDEGELERTGQPLCIYEIYDGAGTWPFLHHGYLYRGLSLSRKARRPKSDDVDAVSRLALLESSYYRNILCEIGGMFSIANKVDNIHGRPWIGFQSWRATARKVSLSVKVEKVLEERIQNVTKGDVIYFWAVLDMNGVSRDNKKLDFWSICDTLNANHCRSVFEDAFRHMYDLPSHVPALPPMPEDGGYWSALHSWVMPTASFVEFAMFSRMFVDSVHALLSNTTSSCILSSTEIERRHCYCRMTELLVNVWAYHSSRKMVYLDPHGGALEEQHPTNQRRGRMWCKFFASSLLKSMDEDLAEAADDGDRPRERWLWPFTGEVHWEGAYEREREQRYRMKMDKKRKSREKLHDRLKSGYKQKPLAG